MAHHGVPYGSGYGGNTCCCGFRWCPVDRADKSETKEVGFIDGQETEVRARESWDEITTPTSKRKPSEAPHVAFRGRIKTPQCGELLFRISLSDECRSY